MPEEVDAVGSAAFGDAAVEDPLEAGDPADVAAALLYNRLSLTWTAVFHYKYDVRIVNK